MILPFFTLPKVMGAKPCKMKIGDTLKIERTGEIGKVTKVDAHGNPLEIEDKAGRKIDVANEVVELLGRVAKLVAFILSIFK